MTKLKKSWRWAVFLSLILVILSAGCGNNAEPEKVIDATPPELEKAEDEIIQSQTISRVIQDCDVGSQEAVLISEQIPDWSILPINACYQLWLQLKDDPRAYDGRAQITYTNETKESLDELVFRLYPNADRVYGGSLDIKSAQISGNHLQPEIFLEDNTGLRLNLEDPIQPGETVVIELDFNGRLTNGFQDSPGTYGIFTYSERDDVATFINWYPILAVRQDGDWQSEPVIGIGDAVISEVGLYLVEITAPADLQVVTGGSLIGEESQNGEKVYRFASGPVRDFPVVASPNFIMIQDEVDAVNIQHWGLSGGEELWDEALQSSANSLEVFNELFGRYPYRELDIVVVPLQLASGVEYPGLFLMRDDLYSNSQGRSFLLTTIISHETAHQWWYGLVGNDVIENPWQDEALTTFSSLIYLEQFEPQVHDGTVYHFEQISEEVNDNLANSGVRQPVAAFIDQAENYSPVVYSKGALFFLELRKEIGDQAFFTALQEYFSNNLYKIASPDSLLDEFENSCQCELRNFYSEWGLQ